MCEYVEVMGVRVTGDKLARALSIMAEANTFFSVPDGYVPSLSLFGPPEDGITPTPEQNLYSLMNRGGMIGHMTRAMVGSEPYEPEPEPEPVRPPDPPDLVLGHIGFPPIVAHEMAYRTATSPKLDAWLTDCRGRVAPWLWVQGSDKTDRTVMLARAALMIDHAMFDGMLPRDQITYVTARRLSDLYNRALNYGERGHVTKGEAMEPYEQCRFLLIDGMGGERVNGRGLDAIACVIESRHENELSTVISSPKGLGTWIGTYGERDGEVTRAVAGLITDALSGYARGTSTESKRDAVLRHVIDLDRPAGGASRD